MTLTLVLVALASDWTQLNQSALAALAQGQFTEAERLSRAAVEAAPPGLAKASTYMGLGRIYRDWARCEPAVRAVERGVALFEKAGDRALTMEAASQLVSVFLECGALDRARAVHKRYVDIAFARQNLAPTRLAHVLGNAGVIAYLRKRLDEAESLLREAITLARPIDQGVLYGSLAMVMLQGKRLPEALTAATRSLEIIEQELGRDNPLQVLVLANLSTIHARLGHMPEAAVFHDRAVAMIERGFGRDHPLLADVLTNRARVLRDNKRKDEARDLEARAELIRGATRQSPLDHAVSLMEMRER